MGRRGTKSKTNGDSAPVAVNIDDNESVDQDSVENGEDPLAEVENESENESSVSIIYCNCNFVSYY